MREKGFKSEKAAWCYPINCLAQKCIPVSQESGITSLKSIFCFITVGMKERK